MRCLLYCWLPFLFIVRNGELKKYTITGFAQGTTYSITYYATDSIVIKRQVDSILDKIDSSLSLYKPYSIINQFNNSRTGRKIDNHFVNVIKKSILVYHETNGLFDVTVKPLVQAWGFGVTKTDSLPGKKEIEAIKKCVGTNRLLLEKNYLSKKDSCVQVDLNGIAQGYSVDVIADFIEKNGIKNYLVELGGEIRVKGRKQPSGEKMKIGIESPDEDEFRDHPMQKIISLENGAITTSGNYRKYYESDGKKITHIIDPKTGYPVQNELISVTVYAKDGMTADAYDNALMLMGLKKALQFIEKRKELAAYFIYKDKTGKIADTASSRFYKLMNP
ncbi:MAG: FAD:protein FMN transferase [Bacteroidetes bacterium]|nr:MAG: FAD:protein FMN transferase [Bacteroidota bacterium]